RRVAVALVLALSCAAIAAFAQTSQDSRLAQKRGAHLRHGINPSECFAQVYDQKAYTKEHFEMWTTAQDIALIKAMEFDHVRLRVNPEPMFRRKEADRIPEDYLGYLDAAVKMILDQGLAVIIEIHPVSDFKEKLANDNAFVEPLEDVLRVVGVSYSTVDVCRVFVVW